MLQLHMFHDPISLSVHSSMLTDHNSHCRLLDRAAAHHSRWHYTGSLSGIRILHS